MTGVLFAVVAVTAICAVLVPVAWLADHTTRLDRITDRVLGVTDTDEEVGE